MDRSRNTIRARLVAGILSALLLGGCATINPQEVGYIIGTIAGAALGSAPGAAIGALAGTAAGALLAQPIEAAREKKERQSLQQRLETGPTAPTAPAAATMASAQHTERIWIDEQLIDGRLIPGHFAERLTPTP